MAVDLVLAWAPGMGGDMIRTCLMCLLTPGKWEYKPAHPEFYEKNKTAHHYKGFYDALYHDDKFVSFIDWRGQAQTDLGEGLIHGTHYIESSQMTIDNVMNCGKGHVTFVTANDIRYLKLAQKNWLMKSSATGGDKNSIAWWDNEYDKSIARRPTVYEPNKILFDMGDRKHCFWMDTIYKWESFKQEIENYIGFYDMDDIDNWDIVQQFWQAWIDEQRIKVE